MRSRDSIEKVHYNTSTTKCIYIYIIRCCLLCRGRANSPSGFFCPSFGKPPDLTTTKNVTTAKTKMEALSAALNVNVVSASYEYRAPAPGVYQALHASTAHPLGLISNFESDFPDIGEGANDDRCVSYRMIVSRCFQSHNFRCVCVPLYKAWPF